MNNFHNFLNTKKLFIVAGPCVIESEQKAFDIAREIQSICEKHGVFFVFKSSYTKANRTKKDSYTGPGLAEGIKILCRIKKELNIPICSDVHNCDEIKYVANNLDIIQIPAFLSRQTDLINEAAMTKKYINVKKAPFLSADACKHIVEKIESKGNQKIILTERGNSFGYDNLVVDMRNIPILKKFNHPVLIDATHSNQKPNQSSGVSGGTPEFIETIALSGVAAGADGVFIEVHSEPKDALSDGENMLKLDLLENLLIKLNKIKLALF